MEHSATEFRFKGRTLKFCAGSKIMGILNVTPDSFSDGGKFIAENRAVEHALQMLEDGADIIDVGGESTRPGAKSLSVKNEVERVVPVITKLRTAKKDCILSIDTRKSEVAKLALEAGADIVNDISGLCFSESMSEVVAEADAGLILMHMRGTPETMQNVENLEYKELLNEIIDFLSLVATRAVSAGVPAKNIAIDPGIGFSKNTEQNLEIIANIDKFKSIPYPAVVGVSRKSFIGEVLNEKRPEQRAWGTAGAVAFLAMKNTEILRVHDVGAIKQLLCVIEECRKRCDR